MGSGQSTSKPNTDKQSIPTTTSPTVTCAPCICNYPVKELHLVLAFVAGILLTLLLMGLIFLIIKSYRKCHSSPRALDLPLDPLVKVPSVPDKALTSVSTTSKISDEKRNPLTANHSAGSDSIVYAQIKGIDLP